MLKKLLRSLRRRRKGKSDKVTNTCISYVQLELILSINKQHRITETELFCNKELLSNCRQIKNLFQENTL